MHGRGVVTATRLVLSIVLQYKMKDPFEFFYSMSRHWPIVTASHPPLAAYVVLYNADIDGLERWSRDFS